MLPIITFGQILELVVVVYIAGFMSPIVIVSIVEAVKRK